MLSCVSRGIPAPVAAAAALVAAASTCRRSAEIEGFPDRYVGVGLELKMNGRTPEVVRVVEGGAAAEVGVRRGDALTAIDGVPTDGMSLGDTVARIRGPGGTQVVLTIVHPGEARPVLVSLARRDIRKTGAASDYRASGK